MIIIFIAYGSSVPLVLRLSFLLYVGIFQFSDLDVENRAFAMTLKMILVESQLSKLHLLIVYRYETRIIHDVAMFLILQTILTVLKYKNLPKVEVTNFLLFSNFENFKLNFHT